MSMEWIHLAPHLLGIFMIALSCVPLVFVWQDKQRRETDRQRMQKLRHEAHVAAGLRGRGTGSAPDMLSGLAGGARR